MNGSLRLNRMGIAAIAGLALVTGAGVLSLASAPAMAVHQEEELPSAKEIVDKYVEATGGREAYESLKSQTATGSFAMPAMGINGTVKVYQQAPDKMLVIVEIPGMGKIQRGVNGDVGWNSDPMNGTRLMSDAERTSALRDANPKTILNIEESYESVEVKGIEDVNGEKAYHLVFTPKEGGKPSDQYYSVESGLLIKSAQTEETPMGSIRSESILADYKEVGDSGLKQPHKITAVSSGAEQVMTMEEMTVNEEVPADRFAVPDDVKALIEKEKEAQ